MNSELIEQDQKSSRKNRFLTKSQMAERYNVSLRTIDNLAARRVLPVIRIGRIVRFDPEACDMAMKEFERHPLS